MKTQPSLLNCLGVGTAVALRAGTLGLLGAGQVHAQTGPQYNPVLIETRDLQRTAAHEDRNQPVALLAAKPGGGAYIPWA